MTEEQKERNRISARKSYQKNRERRLAAQKVWRESNKEYNSERQRKWVKENRERASELYRQSSMRNKNKDTISRTPEYKMLHNAKQSAKIRGCDFDLELSDIVIPEYCVIRGTKLIPKLLVEDLADYKYDRKDSPSIDRVDNTKGYTKDNIRIISTQANQLKGALTIELCEQLLKYMKDEI